MIDLVSTFITIVSSNCVYTTIHIIIMLYLKFLKIYLNTVLEKVVLDVQSCILIKFVNNKLVDQVMVSYRNAKSLSKKDI